MKRQGERRESSGICGGCDGRVGMQSDEQVQVLHALVAPWFHTQMALTAWLCWECWRHVWQLRGEDPLGTFSGPPKRKRRTRRKG